MKPLLDRNSIAVNVKNVNKKTQKRKRPSFYQRMKAIRILVYGK